MDLAQIIQLAIELGLTPFNLALIAMVYFMGAQHGMFPKFWSKEDNTPTIKEVHEIMQHLKAHYNDETTENLEIIADNQKDMKRDLGKISSHQDLIRNDVAVIRSKQDEWEKYGVNVRKML